LLYTRAADQYDPKNQKNVCEAITMLEQVGVTVQTYKELQQRYAIVDESIVWYGSVDLLAFGRKDTDVLHFENPDIAGELLAPSGTSAVSLWNSFTLFVSGTAFAFWDLCGIEFCILKVLPTGFASNSGCFLPQRAVQKLRRIQTHYSLQTRTLQGFESSCPLLKKDFGKNYCPCPLLKKQLP